MKTLLLWGRSGALPLVALWMAPGLSAQVPEGGNAVAPPPPAFQLFIVPFLDRPDQSTATLQVLSSNWHPAYVVMLLEAARFAAPEIQQSVFSFLEPTIGPVAPAEAAARPYAHFTTIWRTNNGIHPDYADFKASLYGRVDPRLREYFARDKLARIRLDEILWSGIPRDEPPALVNPQLISVREASHLSSGSLVYGVVIKGQPRAYPLRILAAHQIVRDQIGDDGLLGVYCINSGAVVFYQTRRGAAEQQLGKSGFIYRSAQLLFDEATQSLWSIFSGEPVVGALVGRGIALEMIPSVATTWGDWRRRHPNTLVVSPKTGFRRDYPEKLSSSERPARQANLFPVPPVVDPVAPKLEILAVRATNSPSDQLAVATDFLRRHRVYHQQLGPLEFVILTDKSGAHRVYESVGHKFVRWNGDATVVDDARGVWTMTEENLRRRDGATLKRLPTLVTTWHAWSAMYRESGIVE